MPVLQTDTVIYTFADVVEHVLDLHGIERVGLNATAAKRAVINAYRDLPQKNPAGWSYYFRQRLLQTAASYSTGTIEYDHTGAANERQVTLTTGTWPTWAEYGRIIIADVHYEVDRRISGSIITLREDSNPGADVAASTTYEIYRNAYPLPANFLQMGNVWDIDRNVPLPMVKEQDQHDAIVCFYDTPDTPWHYTIRGASDYYATMQIVFGPPPSTLISYDLLYKISPRPLKVHEYSRGTVAISGTGVTLTGGVLPADCVGSILRISQNGDAPTGLMGENPFVSQHVIKTRTSDTVAVLEESASTVTGKGYVISDPIDIEAGAMLNAFLRMCDAEFSTNTNRKDAMTRLGLAQQAIIEAIEADSRSANSRTSVPFDYFRGEVTTE